MRTMEDRNRLPYAPWMRVGHTWSTGNPVNSTLRAGILDILVWTNTFRTCLWQNLRISSKDTRSFSVFQGKTRREYNRYYVSIINILISHDKIKCARFSDKRLRESTATLYLPCENHQAINPELGRNGSGAEGSGALGNALTGCYSNGRLFCFSPSRSLIANHTHSWTQHCIHHSL